MLQQASNWTYDTAPDSPILRPYGLTVRQLRRLVSAGAPHQRVGQRVQFTESDLRRIANSFQRGRR